MTDSTIISGKIKMEMVGLVTTVNEIVEKFRQLKNPITESKAKVPTATRQLDKVSEQTEAAANQMLDYIEKITDRGGALVSGLKDVVAKLEGGQTDGLLATVNELVEKADQNCNDAFVIMDALQFQDITSQQINHAASLLEEIEDKLNAIVSLVEGCDGNDSDNDVKKQRKERAFDPNADLYEKKTQQADIDDLFAKREQQKEPR